MKLTAAALASIAGTTAATSFAQTPQMGWNSWNSFKSYINASVIRETADLLVSLGLKDAGYNYLLLDEGWSSYERTADDYLQANATGFPDGIKALAD